MASYDILHFGAVKKGIVTDEIGKYNYVFHAAVHRDHHGKGILRNLLKLNERLAIQ